MFKVNELVVLKNDPNQIVFVINEVLNTKVFLFGYIYRIQITTEIDKIELANKQLIEKEKSILNKTFEKTISKKNRLISKAIFGTVLHIDSDEKFFTIWTVKEAYLKLTGDGLKGIKKLNTVINGEIKIEGYNVLTKNENGYVFSIVYK